MQAATANGGKQNLKADKLKRLGSRRILLYPDADSFDQWHQVAQSAQKLGLRVNVSTLIEKQATDEQKASGYDLADYLIIEQQPINSYKAFIGKQFLTINDN